MFGIALAICTSRFVPLLGTELTIIGGVFRKSAGVDDSPHIALGTFLTIPAVRRATALFFIIRSKTDNREIFTVVCLIFSANILFTSIRKITLDAPFKTRF